MFSEAPCGMSIGACITGRIMVAAVSVAVFRIVTGSPPTFTVSVGVVAKVAANIRSASCAPIGNVMLAAPSGQVIEPAASLQ